MTPWVWIICLALALRLAFFQALLKHVGPERLTSLSTDMVNYYQAAQLIFRDLNWSSTGVIVFGPGYPTIIAIMGSPFDLDPGSIILVQVVISSIGAALQGYLAYTLTENRAIGIVTGCLSACSLLSIFYASFIWSEAVFVFMLQVALVLLAKARWHTSIWPAVVSGVLVGAAILTRSVAQLSPVFLAGWTYWWIAKADSKPRKINPRAATYALLLLLIPAVMIGGWSWHNKIHLGVSWIAQASPAGMGKAFKHIRSQTDGISYAEADSILWTYVTKHEDFGSNTRKAVSEVEFSQFLNTALDYPIETICFLGKNAFHNATVDATTGHLPSKRPTLFRLIDRVTSIRFLNLRTLVLAVIGLVILIYRRRFVESTLLAGICLYFGVMGAFAFNQGARIFFPANIGWTILVAVAITAIAGKGWQFMKRKARQVRR